MEFSRPEYCSGEPFPSLGDLSNPGIEPRSPALQADSLPAEPQGKWGSNDPKECQDWSNENLKVVIYILLYKDSRITVLSTLLFKEILRFRLFSFADFL